MAELRDAKQEDLKDFALIYLPKVTGPSNYKRRSGQYVKGRGKIDVSLRHPQFCMPIARRWFNKLKRKPRS